HRRCARARADRGPGLAPAAVLARRRGCHAALRSRGAGARRAGFAGPARHQAGRDKAAGSGSLMSASLLLPLLLAGRFAIVATAGEAAGQTSLRYVDADADRVRSVLEDLGGVDADHVLRVRNATPASMRAALVQAEA